MNAVGGMRRRVLVLYCPGWSSSAQRSPAQDEQAGPGAQDLDRVISVLEEFCPQVEVLHPGVCAISVRGPARYFGGEEELARKISEAIIRRGLDCRTGIADGLFTAVLAARAEPSGAVVPPGGAAAFLAPFPVTALEIPELDDLLPRLGITTLGEFAALPAAVAANRLGAQGVLAHRLARGLDPRPLVPRQPAADLSVEWEFDPPAEQSEPVVFAAKALADQLQAGLAARRLACVRMRVQAVCEDGREIIRLWRYDGLLSAVAVAERVRWQLESWRTSQDLGAGAAGGRADGRADGRAVGPGGGITLLRLTPDQLVRDEGRQLGLWGDAVVSDRVARAAAGVQAMLGHGAVTRPVLAGGRSPAEQVLLVPFGDAAAPLLPAGRPWPGNIPAPAPATVYPAPLSARITDSSGTPVTVTGRVQMSDFPALLSAGGGPPLAVISWAGPWPATERWWDPPRARRRARFQIVTEDGSAWLAVVQDGRWLIEASYDLMAYYWDGARVTGTVPSYRDGARAPTEYRRNR
jgi:protein ImuB